MKNLLTDEAYEKVPKYYLLKQELIRKINSDELLEDHMIPSERKLIDTYGLSRITVRRAINDLVNEGYLYKIQGKGTYVKGDKRKQDLFSITSCTDDIINLGMTPSRKVLNVEVMEAYPKRSRQLEIDRGEQIVTVDRVYFANDEPINHTIAYLPAKYFPKLEAHDFETQSLYTVLEQEYGVVITRATRTIEAVIAEGETAELLEVEEGVPIILFRGTTFAIIGNKEVPIETFKCHYRSDKFKFYINQIKK